MVLPGVVEGTGCVSGGAMVGEDARQGHADGTSAGDQDRNLLDARLLAKAGPEDVARRVAAAGGRRARRRSGGRGGPAAVGTEYRVGGEEHRSGDAVALAETHGMALQALGLQALSVDQVVVQRVRTPAPKLSSPFIT